MGLSSDRSQRAVEALAGLDGALADDLRGRWTAHVADPKPLLVVFGEHDSGKSALVARLLVDAGDPIPEDLRIGPRAEAAAAVSVQWDGWRILDLPGIGSEREQHDDTAWAGLELADAVLVVMQPKLLTGEGLEILRLVDGSWFTPDDERFPWNGGLVFAVAQADTGSEDLELLPDAAPAYRAHLREALDTLCAQVGGIGKAEFHVTAASPNAVLEHAQDPTRAMFDRYREWDGVDELAGALRRLADERDALREAAFARVLLRYARVALERTNEDRRRMTLLRDRAVAREQTRATIEAQIDSLEETTEVRLKATLTECCAAVYDRAPSPETGPGLLRSEFATRAEAFERAFQTDLNRVLEEASRLVGELPELSLEPNARQTPTDAAGRKERQTPSPEALSKSAASVARSGVEFRLGDSVDAVKAKLKRLEGADPEALEQRLKAAGFESLDQAESAKKLIKHLERAETALNAVPQVVQLGEALWGIYDERRSKRRAQSFAEREEEYVAALAKELMGAPETGFRSRLDLLRRTVGDALGANDEVSTDLDTAIGNLNERVVGLRDALRDFRAADLP